MTDQSTLIYCAGYFDGEGCVSYSIQRSSLVVRIGSSDKEILEIFAAEFGGEVRPTFYKPAKRQMYVWGIYNGKAQAFLLQILPWLKGKKQVAELALQLFFGKKSRKLTDEEWDSRARIEADIRAINQRVTSV